ncbi:MAG: hypothetical protein KBD62_32270 [Kofleriaceae bacterium]|nr:hypothetical protein [Kofleriaceae bacterium]
MTRTNLTDSVHQILSDFDEATFALVKAKINEHDGALDYIGAPTGASGAASSEAISAAGALTPAVPLTELTVSGTKAYTLAAPTSLPVGFRKRIRCVSAASTPAGTLTITDPDATAGFVCSATFFFDAVGQEIELEVTSGTKWRAVRVVRAGSSGVDGVVVGTTVLTGKNLWAAYYLSVTGTATSTTTKSIPDGSAPGEIIQIGCSTAATIPSGTITMTGTTTLGATGTKTLGTFNATTVWASLRWTGVAWLQTGGVTAVLA